MLGCLAMLPAASFAAAPAPGPDTLVFANGDTLHGKLVGATAAGVVFNSDMAGSLTVKWENIKTLDSLSKFAVLKTGERVTKKTPANQVPQGTVAVADKKVNVTTPSGVTSISTSETQAIVDSPSFEKTVYHDPGLLHGYVGAFTLGITEVESTQTASTFSGALNLARIVPNATWIAPRNKTIFDATAIYGLQQQKGTLTTPYSSVKTDIIHGDLERDEYIQPKLYYLGYSSVDHNYSQGLALQDIFGGGFGYTVLKNPRQQLDVKTDLHYEQQQFVAGAGTPNENLIGMDFAETYARKFPKGLGFTETGVITPSFNDGDPYSASFTGIFTFPVYKRLSFNASVIDAYISNPAPTFNANSFQFTIGATYAFK